MDKAQALGARGFEDHKDRLIDLGHKIGVMVVVGPRPAGAVPLGDAPMSAQLCRTAGGDLFVHVESVDSYSDVESTLHEMAHAIVGLDEEWPCFELQAKWALRFGPRVAAEVARVAWESGGDR